MTPDDNVDNDQVNVLRLLVAAILSACMVLGVAIVIGLAKALI